MELGRTRRRARKRLPMLTIASHRPAQLTSDRKARLPSRASAEPTPSGPPDMFSYFRTRNRLGINTLRFPTITEAVPNNALHTWDVQ